MADIGYALHLAQIGKMASSAKVLKGFGGESIMEVVAPFRGDTSRAVYTVRFREVVYVLHCFQKKSKTGIKTPKRDLELIRTRLADAELHFKAMIGKPR